MPNNGYHPTCTRKDARRSSYWLLGLCLSLDASESIVRGRNTPISQQPLLHRHDGEMELRTKRLVLREYEADDFAAVHAFASDRQIAEFVEWGPNTPADTRDFLSTCLSAQEDSQRAKFTLAITVPGGDPVGSIGLSVTNGQGELGYVVAPSHQGQGYATEAAESLLQFGIDELGLLEIRATCRPENVASARVLRKIGMTHTGLRKADKLIRGQWRDSLVFSISTGL